jgi:hypothetical protein
MIAPDAQRHPVACVGQRKLAIRLLFARELWRRAFHLHVRARRRRSIPRRLANFRQGEQIHCVEMYHDSQIAL